MKKSVSVVSATLKSTDKGGERMSIHARRVEKEYRPRMRIEFNKRIPWTQGVRDICIQALEYRLKHGGCAEDDCVACAHFVPDCKSCPFGTFPSPNSVCGAYCNEYIGAFDDETPKLFLRKWLRNAKRRKVVDE